MLTSMSCSCRGPGFVSSNPQWGGGRQSITPVPGESHPYSGFCQEQQHSGTRTRKENTHVHIIK